MCKILTPMYSCTPYCRTLFDMINVMDMVAMFEYVRCEPRVGIRHTFIKGCRRRQGLLIANAYFTRKARPEVLRSIHHHGLQLFIRQIKRVDVERLICFQRRNGWRGIP